MLRSRKPYNSISNIARFTHKSSNKSLLTFKFQTEYGLSEEEVSGKYSHTVPPPPINRMPSLNGNWPLCEHTCEP